MPSPSHPLRKSRKKRGIAELEDDDEDEGAAQAHIDDVVIGATKGNKLL